MIQWEYLASASKDRGILSSTGCMGDTCITLSHRDGDWLLDCFDVGIYRERIGSVGASEARREAEKVVKQKIEWIIEQANTGAKQ